jgi:hypothetical protein
MELFAARDRQFQAWKELVMQDAIFLVVTILFFVISLAYVYFCERVR